MKIYNDDCLNILPTIDDKSIDLILCDPPYGTTACKWDSILPIDEMWKQLKRIRKNNAAVILFCSEPYSSMLRCSNLKSYKYDWVWKKRPVNFLNAKKQPLREIENIAVFETHNYYPQGLIRSPKINKRSNSTETNREHGKSNFSEFTNYPKNVLEYIGERGLHPTQKPVALLEYLIKTYSEKGDTVLDFTMGSGSTGIACLNSNRMFIGIEKDIHYFNIASKRLEDREWEL